VPLVGRMGTLFPARLRPYHKRGEPAPGSLGMATAIVGGTL